MFPMAFLKILMKRNGHGQTESYVHKTSFLRVLDLELRVSQSKLIKNGNSVHFNERVFSFCEKKHEMEQKKNNNRCDVEQCELKH